MRPYCKMGANNGLHLLLDAETYDYASSPATSAEGFTLSLLHHLVIRNWFLGASKDA